MPHDLKITQFNSLAEGRHEIRPEDFHRLLARLDADSVLASEAYERLRERLVAFFYKKQHQLDAEELADRTLDEVAKKPASYEIRNLFEFAIGVARYVHIERYRRNSTIIHISNIQDFPGKQSDPEGAALGAIDARRQKACFLKCMTRLKPEERWLVLEYYPTESHDLEGRRRRLAHLLGIDPGALTVRMNRLRAKLVKCCGLCYQRPTR